MLFFVKKLNNSYPFWKDFTRILTILSMSFAFLGEKFFCCYFKPLMIFIFALIAISFIFMLLSFKIEGSRSSSNGDKKRFQFKKRIP